MSQRIEIFVGEARAMLRQVPDKSVQTCVTSPPYWGLRDYGVEPTIWGGSASCAHVWGDRISIHLGGAQKETGQLADRKAKTARNARNATRDRDAGAFCQLCVAWRGCLGLEPTPELYIAHLVEVFREVKRAMRDDGTLWLNLGDSYAGSGKGHIGHNGMEDHGFSGSRGAKMGSEHGDSGHTSGVKPPEGMKCKDLVGIPWMAAFALRADGWYLRSDVVWSKPNPMPESVTDRPTRSHEYLFLLTKSERYFYDAEAIKEPAIYADDYRKGKGKITYGKKRTGETVNGFKATGQESFCSITSKRNKRSVWGISTKPCSWEFCRACGMLFLGKERKAIVRGDVDGKPTRICTCGASQWVDHFAAYPPELVAPCVLAGSSERGRCPKCFVPWTRVVKRTKMVVRPGPRAGEYGSNTTDGLMGTMVEPPTTETLGWDPGCECMVAEPGGGSEPVDPEPCVVLDPFCGSGTTGVVALASGRSFVGVDVNPQYARVTRERAERAAEIPQK